MHHDQWLHFRFGLGIVLQVACLRLRPNHHYYNFVHEHNDYNDHSHDNFCDDDHYIHQLPSSAALHRRHTHWN